MDSLFIRAVQIDWQKISEDSYLQKIEAVRNIDELVFRRPVTFFAGENGSGKSTLLEAVAAAYGFNPEGGTRNYRFSTYDSHSELYQAVRLIRSPRRPAWGYYLRAESFYNVATIEEEYAKAGGVPSHKYHEKSHGESFLDLVGRQFGPQGIYLLDEPEAALSVQRQLTLMIEIDALVKEGSQFIIATHSPILLGAGNAEILSFDGGSVHPVLYEETDSYRITKLFVNDREALLRKMIDDSEAG